MTVHIKIHHHTNSFVNSFIYMGTSFDPKFGPSSKHDTRTWNIYSN